MTSKALPGLPDQAIGGRKNQMLIKNVGIRIKIKIFQADVPCPAADDLVMAVLTLLCTKRRKCETYILH